MAERSIDASRPLVSILLIAYHQADTVGAALRGALAQTYQPLEILASDDASRASTFPWPPASLPWPTSLTHSARAARTRSP